MPTAAHIGVSGRDSSMKSSPSGDGIGATLLLWIGRFGGLLLAFFWLLFFLEHLSEWYTHRQTEAFPPLWVSVAMVLHFGMIVGLAMLVRWVRTGIVVTAVATLGFFFLTMKGPVVAWIVLVNFVPLLMTGAATAMRRRHA